jgi:hypothetical protein
VLVLDAVDDLGEVITDRSQGFTSHGHNCGANWASMSTCGPVGEPTSQSPTPISPSRTARARSARVSGIGLRHTQP